MPAERLWVWVPVAQRLDYLSFDVLAELVARDVAQKRDIGFFPAQRVLGFRDAQQEGAEFDILYFDAQHLGHLKVVEQPLAMVVFAQDFPDTRHEESGELLVHLVNLLDLAELVLPVHCLVVLVKVFPALALVARLAGGYKLVDNSRLGKVLE